MKNKLNVLKCLLLIFISALMFTGCSIMDVLFPVEELKTFDFSGYVYADDMPLSGATVSCGLSETETDDRGYYSFTKLTKVVQVVVSKDGYFFDETKLVYVGTDRSDVNFDGNQYYNVNGVVKKGSMAVANANVFVTSNSGTHSTKTNANGNFYLDYLAGEASVVAECDGVEFYVQNINKESSFITISSETKVTGVINCGVGASSEDFSLKLDGTEVENSIKVEDGKLVFELINVEPNAKVKLESSKYFIENCEQVIKSENEKITFNCQEYYNANITTISGSTKLKNANIILNGEQVEVENSNGNVVLENLYGENTITCELEGFNFNSEVATSTNTNITLIGKFDLNVNVVTDDNLLDGIKLNFNSEELNVTRKALTFENVELDSIIEVLTDNYYVSSAEITIESVEDLTINLYKLYSLELSVTYNGEALPEANVIVGGVKKELSTQGTLVVDNLFDEVEIEITLNKYVFDRFVAKYNNNVVNAVAKKLFDLTGVVKSGSNILSGATIKLCNEEFVADEAGEFTIENLFESGVIEVSKQGYNTKQVEYSLQNSNLQISLGYNVSGVIYCGENVVTDVEVSSSNKTTTSAKDGSFTLENLEGNSTIVFEKAYYVFENYNVSAQEEIVVETNYYIVGEVTDSNGGIANFKVILSDVCENNVVTTLTDSQGKFTFTNLTSEYMLIYDDMVNLTLKPNWHDVTVGGEYNFANNGYGFSGRVMCGSLPVSDVTVSAGEVVTTTNEQGYYKFAILKKPATLTLYKNGYTFNNNGFEADESLDERTDVNFTCSYTINGTIKSLNTPLEGVSVAIQGKTATTNELGLYEISGIEGEAVISVSKQGYTFTGSVNTLHAGSFNFNAYYTQKYKVQTGNIVVSGVTLVSEGTTYTSNNEGIIQIANAQIGTSYTLSKTGYNFVSGEFAGYTENAEVINCTYNITGIVYSGLTAVSGVVVTLNGNSQVITNANGNFAFSNLVGENVLSFTLEGFEFEDVVVTEPQEVETYAKYSVSGYVKVGETALGGVVVTAGKFSTTTNGAGAFTINGLTTRAIINLYKEGYEFSGDFEVNSPVEDLLFSATYMISGTITSGRNGIEGVRVTSSLGGESVLTNSIGYYEIKGQTGIVTLTFEKDGYETKNSQSVNAYSVNQNYSLSYSVVINFSGLQDYSGISISVDGNKKEYSQSSVTIIGLEGERELQFTKLGYSFTPNKYRVSGYIVIDVNIVRYYSANFKVQTEDGLVIKDAIVLAGSKQATINRETGIYSAEELSNKPIVTANLRVLDAENREVYLLVKTYGAIESSGTYTITISNNDYAYFMFVRAYQRLRDSYAYRIAVRGTVYPQTNLTGDQQVGITYKKVGNYRLYENLNYGKGAAGVEPRVSLLTYSDMNAKTVKYQMPTGDAISSNLTATYDMNWTNVSYQDYQGKFGISPEGFFPYNITDATIGYGSITKITFADGVYSFTFQFGTGSGNPANDLVVSNYRKLMNTMVPKQSTKNYNYIKLSFNIDEFGNILSLTTNEEYVVESMSVTVTTKATINYTYTACGYSSNISPIDISSNNAIRATLTATLPANVGSSVSMINSCIPVKRRELENE